MWLNFGRWSTAYGRVFKLKRLYWHGWRWTPFVWVSLRYRDIFAWEGGLEMDKKLKAAEADRRSEVSNNILQMLEDAATRLIQQEERVKELEAIIKLCVETECPQCFLYGPDVFGNPACNKEKSGDCGIYKLKEVLNDA